MDNGQMDHSAHGRQQMAQATPAAVQGRGVVKSIDSARRKVNISHEAIPAIGWPPMTMDFDVAQSVNLGALKPEMDIDFTMRQGGSGMYVIQTIISHGRH
ncbi:copper-binding protein [Reyranella aquatilis]|uniref:Copper-binding protein n=2 Tax=Reyranella aquatilis TaxID=2035356 RepID=A0ABS8KWZ1_9HYPH|nr:copper-binding protein [Reyranella aquatilis]